MKRGTVAFGLVLVVALAACGSSKPKAPAQTTVRASAVLQHVPQGTVNMKWSPLTHELKVDMTLFGLAPTSVHPAHIHKGTCGQKGDVVHALTGVTADAKGTGSSTTTVKNVLEGIPASGWYVNVHVGPGVADDAQKKGITCVNVTNSTPQMTQEQSFTGSFQAGPGAGDVKGGATLSLNTSTKTLTVTLTVSGLDPNSSHANHIHVGACRAQGPVAHGLSVLTAGPDGKASVTTQVQNVSSIGSNWYVNIHNTTDLTNQIGFTPLSCGDVTVSS